MTRGYALGFALLVAAALVWTAGVALAAEDPAPQYSIKDRPWGSAALKRDVASGSPIPINLRYDQLSEQDKAKLNSFYVAMGPGDEPPFPAEGLKPLHEGLVKASNRFHAYGRLVLIARVDADGTVTQVKAMGSPGETITKFATQHLLMTKFKPALCQGQPCAMEFPFACDFRG